MKTRRKVSAAMVDRHLGLIVSLLFILPLLSCAGARKVESSSVRPEIGHFLSAGILLTPGTEIRTEDGSWTISSGKRFEMSAEYAGKPWYPCTAPAKATRESWSFYASHKALRVRVIAPGAETPLYGVLALCAPTIPPRDGMYSLEVPRSFVDQTANGLTVLYEVVPAGKNGPSEYVWILWLSRSPLFSDSPPIAASTAPSKAASPLKEVAPAQSAKPQKEASMAAVGTELSTLAGTARSTKSPGSKAPGKAKAPATNGPTLDETMTVLVETLGTHGDYDQVCRS